MNKWICSFTLVAVGLFSSFRPTPFFDRPQNPALFKKVQKSLPKLSRNKARDAWSFTLKSYVQAQDWHLLGLMTRAALDDIMSVTDIEKIAIETKCEPFIRAILATKNIRALTPKLGISKGELFRIALFFETELEAGRASTGNFMSKRKTGFAASLEYDPETKLSFIHLKSSHGHDELGHGVKKNVTLSILYDPFTPQLVACCTSQLPMDTEIATFKEMQKREARGIVKLFAVTERDQKENAKSYSLICQLYRGGNLAKAIREKYKFSFKQKLNIALDLLSGLEALHEQKLVHRDLTTRNVLLDYAKRGKRKERSINSAICDFGRVTPLKRAMALKTQANMAYMPPEGIIFEKLEGEDYYKSDVYAMGCVLYQLFWGRKCPWIDLVNLKNPTQPGHVREAKFVYDIIRFRKAHLSKLAQKAKKHHLGSRGRFERLILKMIDTKPQRRPSAHELCQEMQNIVSGAPEGAKSETPAAPPETAPPESAPPETTQPQTSQITV